MGKVPLNKKTIIKLKTELRVLENTNSFVSDQDGNIVYANKGFYKLAFNDLPIPVWIGTIFTPLFQMSQNELNNNLCSGQGDIFCNVHSHNKKRSRMIHITTREITIDSSRFVVGIAFDLMRAWPKFQREMVILRAINLPTAFYDETGRILDHNFAFIKCVQYAEDLKPDLIGTSLIDYVDDKYKSKDLFSLENQLEYLKKEFNSIQETGWQLFYGKTISKKEILKNWLVHHKISISMQKEWVKLCGRTEINENKYFTLKNNLVNNANAIAAEFKCMLVSNTDFGVILGDTAFISSRFIPDENGYFYGFNGSNPTERRHEIQRRTIPVAHSREITMQQNKEYQIRIERELTRHLLYINGIKVVEYWDACPLIFEQGCYFSLYFFGHCFMIKDLKIYTKPLTFKLDRLNSFLYRDIAFDGNPLKQYNYQIDKTDLRGQIVNLIIFHDKNPNSPGSQERSAGLYKSIDSRIQLAYNYISMNYNKKIDYKNVAKDSAMSYSHFNRLFKNTYKISPAFYQIDLQLKRAAGMLENTDLKIRDVAESVGYKNANLFSKLFKNKFGYTPLNYRIKRNGS
ncbi:MAG: AraC family transcriptional regulator [bacterium]